MKKIMFPHFKFIMELIMNLMNRPHYEGKRSDHYSPCSESI